MLSYRDLDDMSTALSTMQEIREISEKLINVIRQTDIIHRVTGEVIGSIYHNFPLSGKLYTIIERAAIRNKWTLVVFEKMRDGKTRFSPYH